MAATGRKKFTNRRNALQMFCRCFGASNLNTLLGAPKESAKANYGPSAGLFSRDSLICERCDRVGW